MDSILFTSGVEARDQATMHSGVVNGESNSLGE
jgi:hypothetical protein